MTYENNPKYYELANVFQSDFHEVHCIPPDGFDAINIEGPWTIAFLDHEPPERRGIELRRLVGNTEYIVAHDAGGGRRSYRYGFRRVDSLFKYTFHWNETWPPTSVWSNKHDVTRFDVK